MKTILQLAIAILFFCSSESLNAEDNRCNFAKSNANCTSVFHGYHVTTETTVDKCAKPPEVFVHVKVPELGVSHQHVFEEGEQELEIDKWVGLRIHVYIRHETLHGIRVQVDYHIYSQPMGLIFDHEFQIDRFHCPEKAPETGSFDDKDKMIIGIVVAAIVVVAMVSGLFWYVIKQKRHSRQKTNLVTNMQPDAVDRYSHYDVQYRKESNESQTPSTTAPPSDESPELGSANITVSRPRLSSSSIGNSSTTLSIPPVS